MRKANTPRWAEQFHEVVMQELQSNPATAALWRAISEPDEPEGEEPCVFEAKTATEFRAAATMAAVSMSPAVVSISATDLPLVEVQAALASWACRSSRKAGLSIIAPKSLLQGLREIMAELAMLGFVVAVFDRKHAHLASAHAVTQWGLASR